MVLAADASNHLLFHKGVRLPCVGVLTVREITLQHLQAAISNVAIWKSVTSFREKSGGVQSLECFPTLLLPAAFTDWLLSSSVVRNGGVSGG